MALSVGIDFRFVLFPLFHIWSSNLRFIETYDKENKISRRRGLRLTVFQPIKFQYDIVRSSISTFNNHGKTPQEIFESVLKFRAIQPARQIFSLDRPRRLVFNSCWGSLWIPSDLDVRPARTLLVSPVILPKISRSEGIMSPHLALGYHKPPKLMPKKTDHWFLYSSAKRRYR